MPDITPSPDTLAFKWMQEREQFFEARSCVDTKLQQWGEALGRLAGLTMCSHYKQVLAVTREHVHQDFRTMCDSFVQLKDLAKAANNDNYCQNVGYNIEEDLVTNVEAFVKSLVPSTSPDDVNDSTVNVDDEDAPDIDVEVFCERLFSAPSPVDFAYDYSEVLGGVCESFSGKIAESKSKIDQLSVRTRSLFPDVSGESDIKRSRAAGIASHQPEAEERPSKKSRLD